MKQADYYKRYKVITEVGIGEDNLGITKRDSLGLRGKTSVRRVYGTVRYSYLLA